MLEYWKEKRLVKSLESKKTSLEEKYKIICKLNLGYKNSHRACYDFMSDQMRTPNKWYTFVSSFGINDIIYQDALKEEGEPIGIISLPALLIREAISRKENIIDIKGLISSSKKRAFIMNLIKNCNQNSEREIDTLINFAKTPEFSYFIPDVLEKLAKDQNNTNKIISLIPNSKTPDNLKTVLRAINEVAHIKGKKHYRKLNLSLMDSLFEIDKNTSEAEQEKFCDIAFNELVKCDNKDIVKASMALLEISSNKSVKKRAVLHKIIHKNINEHSEKDILFVSKIITSKEHNNNFKNQAILALNNMKTEHKEETVGRIVLDISSKAKKAKLAMQYN
ncbi:MAG: hypothetical protein N4A43_01565 [Alphaproteobacteria bacterium]|jgi:hypothetical protein|nr:hypothetical protein [Alphaproteobacteria bacterium]